MHPNTTSDETVKYLVNEFADMFAEDNERFDRDKFLSACEPTNRT